MKRVVIIFFIFIFTLKIYSAEKSVLVDLLKTSSLTVHGTSNVVSFRLYQKGDFLVSHELHVPYSKLQNHFDVGSNKMMIFVNRFTSENLMAVRDFRKLMKADQFPSLSLQVNSFDLKSNPDKPFCFSGLSVVNIIITGVSKVYQIPFDVECQDEFITIAGKKRINIRDFGLEPPSEMMGLIKVNEWIEVDFRLVCKMKED